MLIRVMKTSIVGLADALPENGFQNDYKPLLLECVQFLFFTGIRFAYLSDPLFVESSDDCSSNGHHEILVRALNKEVSLASGLCALLDQVHELGALKTVGVVDDVRDPVGLAHLGQRGDLVRGPGSEAGGGREKTDNVLGSELLDLRLDLLEVGLELKAVRDELHHDRLKSWKKETTRVVYHRSVRVLYLHTYLLLQCS